jgi:arylsulfatase A-like enzyme
MSDKPRQLRRLPAIDRERVQNHFLGRIRSLQAVDEAVADAVATLREVGELSNTVVIFTSDNGMLMGEHRLMNKNVPYEQSLRVPLLVRGPGIPRGEKRAQAVTMVDLAPTVLEISGASADEIIDGRSLLPLLRGNAVRGRGTVLIQTGPRTRAERNTWGWGWRGVRTARYTFVRNAGGFVELYDRRHDPAQLRNVADRPRYHSVRAELRRRARILGSCVGEECRRAWPPIRGPQRPGAGPGPRTSTWGQGWRPVHEG